MRYNHKVLFYAVLIFMNIMYTGCFNYNRKGVPQEQNNQGQKPQVQDYKEQGEAAHSKERVLLNVPIIPQKPELGSGCEVTSLTMVLRYAGVNVDKMTLAEKVRKDNTPLVMNDKGNIIRWGNPNDGFVGDITGKEKGFAVYPKPLIELMEQYLPNRAVDLTNQPFDVLTKSISDGRPVIVWVTIDFKLPESYEEWEKNGEKIKGTFDEHAVVLVGYDKDSYYINNPYNGVKNQKVKKETFINIWSKMGNMAISYK